jgi:LysM repeat protein
MRQAQLTVRLIVLLLSLGCLSLPLTAQISDNTGGDSDTGSSTAGAPRAQPVNPGGDDEEGTGMSRNQLAGPGAVQDEEAARERLLKAADQIDLMESNSEANKATLDGIQTQLAKLQDANTALKLQVSTLQDTVQQQQDALDKMQADRLKDRQALIDEVSSLVAEKSSSSHHAHHAEDDSSPPPSTDETDATPAPHPKKEHTESLAPPPDADASGPLTSPPAANADSASSTHDDPPTPAPTETPHPHKGYMYVVKSHETLSLIVDAYRDQGVKVTVTEVRKANGLTSKSVLHVGQKLFIPKPGT